MRRQDRERVVSYAGLLLFKKAFFAGLQDGSITLTFRRWDKPHVRAGGRYRCHPIGVLEVDAISRVTVSGITTDDATRAGFASRDELLAYLGELGPLTAKTELFRIELHHGGDGDRVEIALDDKLSKEDVETIRGKLARLDRISAPPYGAAARSSKAGPCDRDEAWTKKTLALIEKYPRVAASKLAAKVKRETEPFKIDVRKLKKLGLTQSFEVGYEISPRGKAYLAAIKRRR